MNATSVNSALYQGLEILERSGQRQTSRAGEVVVLPVPLTTVYHSPQRRVLTIPERRANPFFHLFESLWMLAGRDDARWLDQFVSDFSSRFAEEGGRQWGAYGRRWRSWFGVDQLDIVVRRLQRDPLDRRVVIGMWDPEEDLFDPEEISEDTGQPFPEPRDLPCNLMIMPRIVDGRLDITVCCRSNDMVWGAYGANAVHFSILQEYLAGRIGVGVGIYRQVSNNFHAYLDTLTPLVGMRPYCGYLSGRAEALAMGDRWDHWDEDLRTFMEWSETDLTSPGDYANAWFGEVAERMMRTHRLWRNGQPLLAYQDLDQVQATDWRMGATIFMGRV